MGQNNLVSNGDFETISQCPTNYSQINYAIGWSSPTLGTPDLLCLCNSSLNSTNSVFGYQVPHSGNNCIAATYIDLNTPPSTPDFREYIQNQLVSTLISGHTYIVTFYVSLGDNLKYSTSRLGCYFSNQQIIDSANYLLSLSPQITNPLGNFVSDKLNWVKIEANYHATGNENYLIVGNFFSDANTDSLNTGSGALNGVSYFIDDVSVVDSASIGIRETDNSSSINAYPNPTNGIIKIDATKLNENGNLKFVIYNALGLEIRNETISSHSISTINLSEFANGTYNYKIFSSSALYKADRLVIIK